MSDVAALVPRSAPTDSRGRGRLQIAPVVVERVVAQTASSVPGVRPTGGRRPLQATARVLGRVASVTLEIGVAYPSPVRETCRQVREQVSAEVLRVTGIEITRLDLQVAALVSGGPGTGRVD